MRDYIVYLKQSVPGMSSKTKDIVRIPKNAPVFDSVDEKLIHTLTWRKNKNENVTFQMGDKDFLKTTKVGPGSLKPDEMFLMIYRSDYHEYYAIGFDLDKMAKQILQKYADRCHDKDKFTISSFLKYTECDDYSFDIYKIPMEFAFDDEEIPEGCLNPVEYVGDYLDIARKESNNWYSNGKLKEAGFLPLFVEKV